MALTGALGAFMKNRSQAWNHLSNHLIKLVLTGAKSADSFDFFLFIFISLRLYLRHMEVPGPGAKSELHLLTCTTATAAVNPGCMCDLCCTL